MRDRVRLAYGGHDVLGLIGTGEKFGNSFLARLCWQAWGSGYQNDFICSIIREIEMFFFVRLSNKLRRCRKAVGVILGSGK